MKKTLLITSYFPPKKGGISNFLSNIFNSFETDYYVLTDCCESNKESNRIFRKIFLSKILWPKWLPLIFKTYKIILNNNIELLQAGQLLPIGTVCYLLNKFLGTKYQVFVYGNDLLINKDSIKKTIIINKILKNADQVIACSNYTKQLAVKNGAIKEKTIVVYPIPENLKIKKISENDILNFKKEKNIENKKIILTVGNLDKRKGHDMVIKSLIEIKREFKNFIYLIVGSGPNKDALLNLITKSNMTNYVKIIDNISNDLIPLYYSICDLFIMPSRFLRNKKNELIDVEGFGMVFLEANLYGKPVIGGKVGGQVDAIEDNVSGYLVDPNSIKQISDRIIRLINKPVLAKQIGDSGKNRVLKKFDWIKEIKKIKSVIN